MSEDTRKYSKKWRIITTVITLTLLAILIGWDFVVGTNPFRGDTVSEITIWAAMRSLTLPIGLGIVSGHLMWPSSKGRNPLWIVMVVLLPLAAIVLTTDLLTWFGVMHWRWLMWLRAWPIVSFAAAVPIGRLAWPQKRV